MPADDITQILGRIREGHDGASDELYGRVYKELKRVAARHMRMERAGHTLQATALVHEVFLRMNKRLPDSFENRARFFGAAVGLMREILIDHARRRRTRKRGKDVVVVRLDEVQVASTESADELLAMNDALNRLSALEPRQARVVELRFFGQLSNEEIAAMLEVDVRTIARDWSAARRWLRRYMDSSIEGQRTAEIES